MSDCHKCGLPRPDKDSGPGINPDTHCDRAVTYQWCDKRYLWRLEEALRRANITELPDWRNR